MQFDFSSKLKEMELGMNDLHVMLEKQRLRKQSERKKNPSKVSFKVNINDS